MKDKLRQLHAEWSLATRQAETEQQALAEAETAVGEIAAAQQLVQEVAQHLQTRAHARISAVVSRCLTAVFAEDAYSFVIRFDKKRGKTEAALTLYRDGVVIEDPKDEAEGGVLDLAAFGLRLACLLLETPAKRRLLILDEPFKNINGREYQERVGALLLLLAKEMRVQFVFVSDDDWLKVGNVINLERR